MNYLKISQAFAVAMVLAGGGVYGNCPVSPSERAEYSLGVARTAAQSAIANALSKRNTTSLIQWTKDNPCKRTAEKAFLDAENSGGPPEVKLRLYKLAYIMASITDQKQMKACGHMTDDAIDQINVFASVAGVNLESLCRASSGKKLTIFDPGVVQGGPGGAMLPLPPLGAGGLKRSTSATLPASGDVPEDKVTKTRSKSAGDLSLPTTGAQDPSNPNWKPAPPPPRPTGTTN